MLPYLQTHLTFAQIAQRLYISRNTVATHVHTIYRKLAVSSRDDAVQRATAAGVLGGSDGHGPDRASNASSGVVADRQGEFRCLRHGAGKADHGDDLDQHLHDLGDRGTDVDAPSASAE